MEVMGDIVSPSEFLLPPRTTTDANSMSGANLMSGAMVFNTTLHKAEVWTGASWETITSAERA